MGVCYLGIINSYDITVLPIYAHFLIQDMSHLNYNVYDKCLMKSFHGADANDDLDLVS